MKTTLSLTREDAVFLRGYRLSKGYLQKPDRIKGIPGLKTGTDPNAEPVIVKIWPRDPKRMMPIYARYGGMS